MGLLEIFIYKTQQLMTPAHVGVFANILQAFHWVKTKLPFTFRRIQIKNSVGEDANSSTKLVELFNKALDNGTEIGKYTDDYGTTITKQVSLKNGKTAGTVNVSFLYRNGETTPEVTTAVPKIIK